MSIEIPNKSHFKLNEVCGLTGIKPYVLRFWETEFPEIAPVLSSSGQKLYEHKDIEALAVIKKLLFDDKLNIEQAKLELRTLLHQNESDDLLGYDENEYGTDVDACESNKNISDQHYFQRKLSSKDIEKLALAKKHLSSLVEMTQSLQKSHHW